MTYKFQDPHLWNNMLEYEAMWPKISFWIQKVKTVEIQTAYFHLSSFVVCRSLLTFFFSVVFLSGSCRPNTRLAPPSGTPESPNLSDTEEGTRWNRKWLKPHLLSTRNPSVVSVYLVSDVNDYLTHWNMSKPTYMKVIVVYVTDADVLAAEL